jgi:membrane protein DedA with SNARE-associated domain
MAHMRRGKFLLYTTLGTAIWNVVLVCLGAFAGAGWERINKYMDVYSYIALAIMAIIGIGFIIWIKKKRKVRRQDSKTE